MVGVWVSACSGVCEAECAYVCQSAVVCVRPECVFACQPAEVCVRPECVYAYQPAEVCVRLSVAALYGVCLQESQVWVYESNQTSIPRVDSSFTPSV